MKHQPFARLALAFLLVTQSAAFAAGGEAGFKSIFNGQDLAGWDGNPKCWSVRDGAITGETSVERITHNTFLIWTNGVVGDFELRCTYRLAPVTPPDTFANSGIQYRSKVADPAGWVVGGYQADMENGDTYSGILYEERGRGVLASRGEKVVIGADGKKTVVGSVGNSAKIQAAIKKGGWNEYVIIAKGNHLVHRINGRVTVDVTDEQESKAAKSGILALQLHAGTPMIVQFKDLRLKTLE